MNLFNILRIISEKLKIFRSKGMMQESLKQKLAEMFNYTNVSFALNVNEDLTRAINSFLHSCSKEEMENEICK